MKYRISQWLDTSDDNAEEYPILYGIQGNVGNGWQHCHMNGEPLIYSTHEEAANKIKSLKEDESLCVK